MRSRKKAASFGLSDAFVDEGRSGSDEEAELEAGSAVANSASPMPRSFHVLRRGSSHPMQTTPLAHQAVDIMLDEAASPCGNGILLHMTELGISIEQLLLGIASRLALTSGSDDPVLLRQRSQAQRLIGYIISHRSYCRRLRNSAGAIRVFEERLMQPDVVGRDVVTVTSIYREMIDEESDVGVALYAGDAAAAGGDGEGSSASGGGTGDAERAAFSGASWARAFARSASATDALADDSVALVMAKVWTRIHRRLALRSLNVSCLVPGTDAASIARAERGVAAFASSAAHIELWLQRQIVAGATPSARAAAITTVVAIGCAARDLANFHLAACCASALRARAVTRLDASWYMVAPAVWVAAKDLLRSMRNEAALYDAQTRAALSQGRCIPHLPTLLKVTRRLCRRLPLWSTQNAETAQAIFDRRGGDGAASAAPGAAATPSRDYGECSFIYRYIPRESCSQFDSLPLTYLTIPC